MLSDSTKNCISIGVGFTASTAIWFGGLKMLQSQIRKGKISKAPKKIFRWMLPELSCFAMCYGGISLMRPMMESNMNFRLKMALSGFIVGSCLHYAAINSYHSIHYWIFREYNSEFVDNDDPNDPKLDTSDSHKN